MIRAPSVHSQDDPLTLALRPPSSETDDEREIRLREEAEAKETSDKIDEELKLEKQRLQKAKGDVKLLLLGQAESGKSTLQKQFQLMYSPNSLETERASWRTVVYFNIVRSLKHILATLAAHEDVDDETDADSTIEFGDDANDGASILAGPSTSKRSRAGQATAFTNLPASSPGASSSKSIAKPSRTPKSPGQVPLHKSPQLQASAHQIANLRLRLSPLLSAEDSLAKRLNGGVSSGTGEVFVRSGWQVRTLENGGLAKARRPKRSTGHGQGPPSNSGPGLMASTAGPMLEEDSLLDEVSAMLEGSKEDIKALWEYPTVVALIAKRKLKLDEWSEFFLKNILRIAKQGYIPTTEDILHARIQTMGVAEHNFEINIYGKSVMWHLYDVGGARGQRHTWVPYFDTANAIIFVAPISAFDQYLEEDPRTNRIDDSLQLFTQICANPLLKKAHLVLFLNKTDLLKAKLDKGLKVQKYILSFGDRANEFDSVVQYFRAHFLQVHRRNNENRRVLYTHLTSVVDTKTTQSIIANVRDSIFRGYLQSAALV
jgi:guanine nucleotide-binding protein subunit alpha